MAQSSARVLLKLACLITHFGSLCWTLQRPHFHWVFKLEWDRLCSRTRPGLHTLYRGLLLRFALLSTGFLTGYKLLETCSMIWWWQCRGFAPKVLRALAK